MLARDIYRDIYLDSRPTIEQRLLLAGKRIGIAFAGCALLLGALDIAGLHSIVDIGKFAQAPAAKFASLRDNFRIGAAADNHTASALVEIPKTAAPKIAASRPAVPPSAVEALAATRRKDAVTLAMAAPAANERPPSVLDGFKTIPADAAPLLKLPVAVPVRAKPAVLSVPEAAARAQASELPEPELPELKLASLPAAAEPVTPSLPLPLPQTQMLPQTQPDSAPAPIPLSQVPLPRAAPPLSPADRLGLRDKEYARAERCLANAIYFEARSEPVRGQEAVAQVVLNRVFSGFYPNDVCSVVYQNASRHLACQFTFACDGKSKAINERGQWAVANRIARETLDGQIYVPEVAKSTHYHAAYVHPNWVREMKRLVRFGVHSFYRPYAWGNGAEEPVWGSAASATRTKTASR